MPTTTPVLLRGLVDDAAVFPPGNASVTDAVTRHAVHRRASYAGCVGPLLLPAAAVADLVRVLDEQAAVASPTAAAPAGAPLEVVLVARPGADPATVTAAVDALRDDTRVRVVGAEVGWYAGWAEALGGLLPLAVELPRGAEADQAFTEVRTAHREGLDVVLKFRTGPTPVWPWPDEAELGSVLSLAAAQVPFKLTGGLHHAGRGTYEVAGVPEENHGVLNVLLATSAALEAASADEVTALLGIRDARALADLVAAWPDATAARVRASFTAYGCCTVTDPLGELADLGLLPQP